MLNCRYPDGTEVYTTDEVKLMMKNNLSKYLHMITTALTIGFTTLALFLAYKLGGLVKQLEHEIELADFRSKILLALANKLNHTEEGTDNAEGN